MKNEEYILKRLDDISEDVRYIRQSIDGIEHEMFFIRQLADGIIDIRELIDKMNLTFDGKFEGMFANILKWFGDVYERLGDIRNCVSKK